MAHVEFFSVFEGQGAKVVLNEDAICKAQEQRRFSNTCALRQHPHHNKNSEAWTLPTEQARLPWKSGGLYHQAKGTSSGCHGHSPQMQLHIATWLLWNMLTKLCFCFVTWLFYFILFWRNKVIETTKFDIMAKTAGSPCLCHLKHLLSTLSGAQQALTHSLFLTTNKTMWRIWEAQIVSSFVSSCFNHLNGSHRRSHIAPNCSIIYIYIFSQFNTMFVYYVFMLNKYTYTARSYMYSGGSHRTSPLSKSDALLAFAPGLHRRSLLVPKRSTLLLRCTGAKVGRLEGWKVGRRSCTWHLWNGPSSVQSSGSGWVRLQNRTSLEVRLPAFSVWSWRMECKTESCHLAVSSWTHWHHNKNFLICSIQFASHVVQRQGWSCRAQPMRISSDVLTGNALRRMKKL